MIQYDHSLTDIHYNPDNTVTAEFANGATEIGSMIVGADGPRSAVRCLLLSEEAAAVKPLENVIHTNITFCPQDKEKAMFLRSAHPGKLCGKAKMSC